MYAIIEALAVAARELGNPIEGAFAESLWRALSGPPVPADQAAVIYRTCGYEPFSGYPLRRLEQLP